MVKQQIRVSAFNWLMVLVLVGGLVGISSCKNKNDNFVPNYSYNYYPLDSGHYVIWDVDSFTYFNNGVPQDDTVHYQWMQVVSGDTFLTSDQVTLDIYRRSDSTQPWQYDRKWYASRNATNLYIVQDDIKFIKLIFPPKTGDGWNGNIFVPDVTSYEVFKNWDYKYLSIDQPYTINGSHFDSALIVSEVADSTLINKTLRKEVYARKVGLIYQEWEVLKKNVQDNFTSKNNNGFKIRMRISGHN